MTLSIDEIAIYVKQEIGRDLFENVDKKESYLLDLRLVVKYKYPIDINIDNK